MAYYLELYKGKFPESLEELPGAAAYSEADNVYWAVLMPRPEAGSEAEAYLRPSGPSQIVRSTTHGTDTLPADARSFTPSSVCVWRPKYPPYKFSVRAPGGEQFIVDPTPPFADGRDDWYCASPPLGNCIGIWVILVEPLEEPQLPMSIDGRNAHLNPSDYNFGNVGDDSLKHQPLLRIVGDEKDVSCPELRGVSVVSGCAPGEVCFAADIRGSVEDIIRLTWESGDGQSETLDQGDITSPVFKCFTYTGTPTGQLTLTIERASGCGEVRQTSRVAVPLCPPPTGTCATLDSMEVVSGCAPGEVRFRANITGDVTDIEALTWSFGDGNSRSFPPDDNVDGDNDPTTTSHTYQAVPPNAAAVSIFLREGCSPRMPPPQTAGVPWCPPARPCPTLDDIRVTDGCAPGPVSFEADITGDAADIEELTWSFGDGTTRTFSNEDENPNNNVTLPARVSRTYQRVPEREATVTILRREGCTPRTQSLPVDVPACKAKDCPELTGVNVDGCAPGEVTLTAQGSNLDQAEGFEWDFGDGQAETGGATITHTYDERDTFEVKVTMTSPDRCQADLQDLTVTVPKCKKKKNGEPSCLCLILFWVVVGLLALAVIAVFVASCAPNPLTIGIAIGLCVVAIIVLLVWLWLCGGSMCVFLRWLLTILAILAVVFLIAALILAGLAALPNPVTPPCAALASFISGCYLGAVSGVLYLVGMAVGCVQWPDGTTGPLFSQSVWRKDFPTP